MQSKSPPALDVFFALGTELEKYKVSLLWSLHYRTWTVTASWWFIREVRQSGWLIETDAEEGTGQGLYMELYRDDLLHNSIASDSHII